jgi:C4-dicarboxylate-specific signal transduction histidine kinase
MSRSTKRRRNVLLQSWLTPVEAQTVRRKAADSGVSVSEFMRSALFRYKPRPTRANTQELSKLGAEMGKIGSNINQYAKSRNMGRASDNLDLAMEGALRELLEWRTAVMQALGAERKRKIKTKD